MVGYNVSPEDWEALNQEYIEARQKEAAAPIEPGAPVEELPGAIIEPAVKTVKRAKA